MARKVMGPKGSKRRARFLILPLLLAACTALFFVAGAQAVHDTGLFQLDGNATTVNPPAGDDWDHVCHQVTGSDCSTSSNTNGATAVDWTAEPNLNSTIFTGGGSKDPQDISSWAWKDGAGGLPDKDNLLHSFAARYSVPSNANCPGPGGNTDGTKNCDVLFFGSDRLDNSGDAQQGFWFFQNKITLGSTPSGGGFNFSGVHKNGDLLIISDFSNGGSTSTISVYVWNNAVSGNLQLLQTSNAANCGTAAATDAFCGIVNGSTITMPWSFTDKSGTPNNGALNGEFYEGGINLSKFNLGGECFSSIASETRSSTSTTATLKDFVLGQFAVCGASMTTTPSTTGEVSPGQSVTDQADVTGTGTSSPPDPTGNVTFFLCSVTGSNTCDSGGTQVGNPVPLDGGANTTDGLAHAISGAVNTAQNPLLPGKYCFRAEWPGDSNYSPPTPPGKFIETNPSGECFTVRTIPTTTTTTPSNVSGQPLGGGLLVGVTLYDKAVVTGTAVGGNPPGTINFFVCDPTQVQGAAGSENCPSGFGTPLGGNPRTLLADAGSSPPTSSVLSSPGVQATSAGVWCFRAEYTHSGTTYEDSHDSSHGECVTVGPLGTTTVTTPQSGGNPISGALAVNAVVTDHALVTAVSTGDGTPTGTINFFICSPLVVAANGGDCHANGTPAGSKTANAVAGSSPPASSADSDQITASSVGTWCFRAEYVPGGANGNNYTGSSDSSTGECFLVQDSTAASSEQDWLPNDTAHISSTGGTALNGSLTITLYESADCSGTAVTGQSYPFTLTNETSPVTRSTSNSTYLVTADKTVSWKIVFTPDAGTNVTGSSHCETTSLTITN
jgi:hypothetical protein